MSLKQMRQQLLKQIDNNKGYLRHNAEAMDIYNGNLLPYVDKILQATLSKEYYSAIKHRSLPINILQRYIDKISTLYTNPPTRISMEAYQQEFVDFYSEEFDMNQVGLEADQYSNLFKSFALEPYINIKGEPSIRVLSSDQFLVYSDSDVNPEEETVFLKIIGNKKKGDEHLIFAYTDTEFDAFYTDGADAPEYLVENGGVNPIGVIPFVYGKRQKNRLIPVPDSDTLAVTKAIPVMLTDGAGAQMFQAFSIMYGVDINAENLKMSPNAFWSLKSDKDSDKNPQVGVVKPEASTEQIMSFVTNIFILWLETKGIRVNAMGNVDSTSTASGISKIIDEMDAYNIVKKSSMWFEDDEEELWNEKMPAIHNYWIKSGQINPAKYPPIIPEGADMEIEVTFENPEPMISRTELLSNVKAEMDMGTMTLKQAVEILHPKYNGSQIEEVLNERDQKEDNNTVQPVIASEEVSV